MGARRRVFLVLIFILPLFMTAFSPVFPENLRDTFFSLSKPVLAVSETFRQTFTSFFTHIRRSFYLYQENEKLQKELAILENQVISLREQSKENERLRSLLDFRKTSAYRTMACRIIARDVTHLSNWAVLDKGSRDGLKKEMPVVNEQGLVGKIVELGFQTARVILLTDVEAKVSGIIQSTRDTGLVTGDGSSFLRMKYIDLDSTVKVGDEIVSSGLGDVYPKGLPVGKVESLSREKNGLHLYARVRPAVSFSKIEEVLCLDYRAAS